MTSTAPNSTATNAQQQLQEALKNARLMQSPQQQQPHMQVTQRIAQSQPNAANAAAGQMNSTLAGQLVPSPGTALATQAVTSQQQAQPGITTPSPQMSQLSQLVQSAGVETGKGGKNGPSSPAQGDLTSRNSKPMLTDIKQEFPTAEPGCSSTDSTDVGGKCIKSEVKEEVKEEPMETDKLDKKPAVKPEPATPGGSDSSSANVKSEPSESKPGTPGSTSMPPTEPPPPRQRKGNVTTACY